MWWALNPRFCEVQDNTDQDLPFSSSIDSQSLSCIYQYMHIHWSWVNAASSLIYLMFLTPSYSDFTELAAVRYSPSVSSLDSKTNQTKHKNTFFLYQNLNQLNNLFQTITHCSPGFFYGSFCSLFSRGLTRSRLVFMLLFPSGENLEC